LSEKILRKWGTQGGKGWRVHTVGFIVKGKKRVVLGEKGGGIKGGQRVSTGCRDDHFAGGVTDVQGGEGGGRGGRIGGI